MPYALPPADDPQAAVDYQLPSGMIERERRAWLVDLRSPPRERAPCPEAKDNEIVVCAPKEDDPARDRLGAPLPDAPTAMEEIKQKLTAKVGRGELAPAGDDAPMIGVTYKLKF